MRLRRLGWAGIEVEQDGDSLIVDHLLDPGIYAPFLGESADELVVPEPRQAIAALVTHLHLDHADVPAIENALRPGGTVLRPQRRLPKIPADEFNTGAAEAAFENSNLAVVECNAGDTFEFGVFKVSAVPASDGLGTPQVSWVVETGGRSILHAGDTLWHGSWWDIAAIHPQIDIALLPANGVQIDFPYMQPAVNVPAAMTPEQAVEATRALGARQLAPIHFNGTFEHPQYYRPIRDAQEQIAAHAATRGVDVLFLDPGVWVEVGEAYEPAGGRSTEVDRRR